ncbi:transcriptional regulator [Enterobacter ludwigii]|uniref:winged helix-turn-helix domain-containing protein n=1 Tax=Enterobacter ludwigii TaxID=299767 RepID=UPI00388F8028
MKTSIINGSEVSRLSVAIQWPSGDEGSTVILTLTMNRLLACLLEKHGQVLTRNELLASVWDAYGLRSSSHTLNKYISELRKHFVQLGIADECITTLPRVGFMFNSDIEVREIANPSTGEAVTAENNSQIDAPSIRRTRPQGRFKVSYYALSVIVIFMSAALFWSGLAIQSESPRQLEAVTPHFLFNFGTCPVYTVQRNSASLIEQKKKIFEEVAESNQIQCLEGSHFLYQVSEYYLYGSKGRVFISRCTQKNNEYISCLNNYWSGYERHQ